MTAGYASIGKGRTKMLKMLTFFLVPDHGDNCFRYDFLVTGMVLRVGNCSRSFTSIKGSSNLADKSVCGVRFVASIALVGNVMFSP